MTGRSGWRDPRVLGMLSGVLIAIGLAFALLPETWIENVFGGSPDGGNGLLELGIVLVPLGIGVALGARVALDLRGRRQAAVSAAESTGKG